MRLNFFEIIIRPFRYKNILQKLFTAFVLFVPFIIAVTIMQLSKFWAIILFIGAFLNVFGYLWVIFHDEIKEKNDTLPEWRLVQCFFIGIKGVIFVLGFVALYITTVMTIWLLVHYVPMFRIPALILTVLLTIYWFFFLFATASALFASDFEFNDSFDFHKSSHIAENCWMDYLKALIYLGLSFSIGGLISLLIYWFIKLFYPAIASIGALAFFILYFVMVSIILYAKVYKIISDKYDSYL